MKQRLLWTIISIALLISLMGAKTVLAEAPFQQPGDNETCLGCHKRANLSYEFPNGQVWPLHVDADLYQNSIHGQEGLLCTDCHADISDYPHPPLAARSVRFYQLEQYQVCRDCHDEVYAKSLDSIHAREVAAGNWEAAICTDCHGAHDTRSASEPRTKIPETCSKCHAGIYNNYLESVHGRALLDENNGDVPTCIDCHGVHNQEDPRTTSFRLHSPDLCGTCHANEAMMGKFGISTNVFDTYVADFHGTTVTLFERQSPDLPTNKPVCYDCHGVHNMKSVDDPEAQTYQENLLETCRKCHPDAQENFPASWLSHYEPNLQKYPLVFIVDLFYKILIPATIGLMTIFVVADAGSRLVHRARKEPQQQAEDKAASGQERL